MALRRAVIGAVAYLSVGLLLACGDSSSSSTNSTSTPGAGSKSPATGVAKQAAAKPSVRAGLATWRPLLDEAPRAELDVGGLLVDLGGPDQFKYTRGDWRTGWGASDLSADGVTSTAVPGRAAKLEVLLRAAPVEVAMRVRSAVPGQRMTVLSDGKPVGNGDLTTEWSVVTVPVAAGSAAAGYHEFSIQFGKPATDARAEVDWVWFRSDAEAPTVAPLPRVVPIALGERTRRAMPAATSRTYSFYLQVPKKSSLVFDYGADQPVEFAVRVDSDGNKPEELFRETAKPGSWTEAKVDLSKHSGKAIRLELTTSGPPAKAGWGEPEIMLGKAAEPVAKTGAAPPKHVVVLLIDTVRADVFAPFAPDNKVYTPVFDALAGEGATFLHAYNNENWTKPSVATTLTGLYPVTHDTKKDPSVLPAEVELLSERMKSHGFATAGFVANGFVSDKFGFEQGWDKFVNYIRDGLNSDAEHVFADALAWVDDNKDKRMFLYIQTIDPHVSYDVERSYTSRYYEGDYKGPVGSSLSGHEQADIAKGKLKIGEDDLAWIRALYYGEVSYHDEHFGVFLEAMRSRGLLDDTLLVVTNDHGEELNEHGRLGHGHSLYEELLRAPLVMRYPPLFSQGKLVPEVVENVDVAPTILDALGFPPLKDADGVSLLPLLRGEPVQRPYYAVAEFLEGRRALRVGNYKYERSSGDRVRLYDLTSDPGENEDLTATHDIARRLCDVYLGEALASPDKGQRLQRPSAKRRFDAGEAHIDPALRKQLEALGYFGG